MDPDQVNNENSGYDGFDDQHMIPSTPMMPMTPHIPQTPMTPMISNISYPSSPVLFLPSDQTMTMEFPSLSNGTPGGGDLFDNHTLMKNARMATTRMATTSGRPPKQIGKRKLMQLQDDEDEEDSDEEYLPDFSEAPSPPPPPPKKKPRKSTAKKTVPSVSQVTTLSTAISTEAKANQLMQVAAQLQQTVKRGRGRPKGSKNKKGTKGNAQHMKRLCYLVTYYLNFFL